MWKEEQRLLEYFLVAESTDPDVCLNLVFTILCIHTFPNTLLFKPVLGKASVSCWQMFCTDMMTVWLNWEVQT